MSIKSVNMNISKKMYAYFSSCPKDHSTQKVPGSKGVLCSPRADRQTHTQTHRETDRQTDTKVNTKEPFQGFMNFSFNLSSRIGSIYPP